MTRSNPKPGELLSRKQVAELLGVSERTITRRVKAGELSVIRDGGVARFLVGDLEDYLRRHRTERRLLSGDGS